MNNLVIPAQNKLQWNITRWSLAPGEFMHFSWWEYLGLEKWQAVYTLKKGRLTRQIDLYIRQRLALDMASTMVFPLTEHQQIIVGIAGRWQLFLTSLGLLQLGCPDYLLRREYRQVLERIISSDKINQLIALWRGESLEPELDPDNLLDAAMSRGCLALTSVMENDPIWKLVQIQCPKFTYPEEEIFVPVITNPLTELRRLERFL